jgi:glutathione reductase (NADPH)
VTEHLQSVSNPAIYAGVDAAALGPKLTPKADHDAVVLTDNLLHGNRCRVDYTGFASAVSPLPPLASVGLIEAAAREAGRRVRITHQDTAGWFHTRRVGETASGFKVLIDEDTGLILGAHLLGQHAHEVINLFALAMRARMPAEELRQVHYAYPTYASDVRFMVRPTQREVVPERST